MKRILLLITIICFYNTNAQNEINIIDIIKNVENQKEIDSLKFRYPELSITKHSLSSGDKDLNREVISLKENETKMLTDSSGYIKLLSKKKIIEFKVKYIFIDEKKLSQKEFKNIKKNIFKELDKGKSFSEIANMYSMDPGSKDGDLGWFPEGRMINSFEKAIKEHKKGEIFKVSESSRKWFFVIFKNHDERDAEIYEYIKISN